MAKQSRKARKQEKQKVLDQMTQKQYQTILKLKKYAEDVGKNCEFEKIPGTNNIMKYEEEVVNEENVLEYFFMIGVREDGSVFTTCCKDLNVKEDGKETAAKYIELLDEKSNDTTYSLDEEDDDILLVDVDYDLEEMEQLQENFGPCVFGYVRRALEYCMGGLAALLNEKLTLEEAVDYALDQGETYGEILKRVRYCFEHEILCYLFLEDFKCIEMLKERKEEMLMDVMNQISDREEIENPFEIDEFEIETENYQDYEMIRIKMPEPVQENNCLEIVPVIKGNKVRYFTVEIGETSEILFICEWTLDEEGNRVHHNYKVIKAGSGDYMEEIRKCL